jgi:hypothetical protein
MKIRTFGAELFHADSRMDRLADRQTDGQHDEGNSRC